MKRNKLIAIALFAVMLANVLIQNTSYVKALAASSGSNTASTTVNGSVSASIINVSVPTTLAFTIDPNNDSSNYASVALIENKTNAPVEVSVNGGGSSFKQSNSSAWKPSDYLPKDLNWDYLGREASESSLALGIIAKDQVEWRKLVRKDTLWVKELNGISGSVIIGELDPHKSANVTLQFHHGNAFSGIKSCVYDIVWSFSLAN